MEIGRKIPRERTASSLPAGRCVPFSTLSRPRSVHHRSAAGRRHGKTRRYDPLLTDRQIRSFHLLILSLSIQIPNLRVRGTSTRFLLLDCHRYLLALPVGSPTAWVVPPTLCRGQSDSHIKSGSERRLREDKKIVLQKCPTRVPLHPIRPNFHGPEGMCGG